MDKNEFDSSKYEERLQKIIEEIPSGVSSEDIKSELNIRNAEEIKKYINDTIIYSINAVCGIDKVWSEFNIAEKLAQLQQLEKISTEPAWRPTTGKAAINPVKMEYLKHEKSELQKEIASLREKSEQLKTYLRNGYEQTQQQIKQIESIDLKDKD